MSIYSNEIIRKITKLTPRELLHLVQNLENYNENNGIYTVDYLLKMLKGTCMHILDHSICDQGKCLLIV